MDDILRLCLVQMTSTNHHQGNVDFVARAAEFAAQRNADLLSLPEAAGLADRDRRHALTQVVGRDVDPFIIACRSLAQIHGLWIHIGSTPVGGSSDKFRNYSCLVSPDGRIVADYEKIHLFDVFLEGRPPTGESSRYDPGANAVLVDLPWGPVGLSICYDMRFPHLYRDYAHAGARLLFVPSAFTVPTGRAHWEVLLRARAIENGAWVVAAAQVGLHDDGRRTWGHSLVVDPWGEVVCDMGGERPGFEIVEIDLSRSEAARRQIPSLENERSYEMQRVSARPFGE